MSNLSNFNNIFADLSESSYNNRPSNFPYNSLSPKEQVKLDIGGTIPFDFSKDAYDKEGNLTKGGINLPNEGKIYLQADKTGALTNAKAGYNAYFVTDQPSISDSQQTYFVIDKVKIIQAISFLFTANFQKRAHSIYFAIVFYF